MRSSACDTLIWPCVPHVLCWLAFLLVFALGSTGSAADHSALFAAAAFHKGLNETDYVDGRNVTVEYPWIAGQYDRLPSLMADLVRRHVAVIATPGSNPVSLAAKTATMQFQGEVGLISRNPMLESILRQSGRVGTAVSLCSRAPMQPKERDIGW